MAGVLLPSVKLELVSKAWWNDTTGMQADFFSGFLRGLSSDRETVTKKIQGSGLALQQEASPKAVRTQWVIQWQTPQNGKPLPQFSNSAVVVRAMYVNNANV